MKQVTIINDFKVNNLCLLSLIYYQSDVDYNLLFLYIYSQFFLDQSPTKCTHIDMITKWLWGWTSKAKMVKRVRFSFSKPWILF